MKTALIATALPWESMIRVDTHHLARWLAEHDWHVHWIPYPLSPFHAFKLMDRDTRVRLARFFKRSRVGRVQEHVLFTLTPPLNVPLLRSRHVMNAWPRYTLPHPPRVEASFAYTDSALHAAWLIPLVKKERIPLIYRIADEDEGFKTTPASIREAHARLIREARFILCANRTCMEKHAAYAEKRVYWPNGILLSRIRTLSTILPDEYARIPEPRIVYIGMIDEWFDQEAVRLLVERIPNVHVVLIGPVRTHIRLLKHPRIHLLGPRAYDQIGRYLTHAQLGIIPFNPSACCPTLIENIHPIKLYEYAYFKLPILAFKTRELEHLHPPALLASNREEFVRHAEHLLAHPPTRAERERLHAFAREAAYETRFERLIRMVIRV